MKVVVAIDSFKGCLDSRSAGEAAANGVRDACGEADIDVVPIADGGEGTLDALLSAGIGRTLAAPATDALGRMVRADHVLLADNRTAVVESARTIGLSTVGPVDARVPERASSAGLGHQIAAAVNCGATRVLVGLGGTATTDGGAGLVQVLGGVLRDDAGAVIPTGRGNPLWHFASLDPGTFPQAPAELILLSDVTNPMLGTSGAAHVFGPQKGATPDQVRHLEERMERWSAALAAHGHAGDVSATPGAGAAGGLGAALLALGARIEPGLDRLAEEIGLTERLRGADLVLTGEGSLDHQTAHGKAPARIAALAQAAGAVVVGLAGKVETDVSGEAGDGAPVMTVGMDATFAIHSRPRTATQAMDPATAADDLRFTARQVMALVMRASLGTAGLR